MNYYIHTDLLPQANTLQIEENWNMPEAKKMLIAIDFLKSINSRGFVELYFDSRIQSFTILDEKCKGITRRETSSILKTLNRRTIYNIC